MTREQVIEYIEIAESEVLAGNIGWPMYHKACVTIASEFLKDFADLEQCLITLNKIDPEYFKTDFITQLNQDGLFAEVVLEFIYYLDKFNALHLPLWRPTQEGAEA